jgi:hypothetical protein
MSARYPLRNLSALTYNLLAIFVSILFLLPGMPSVSSYPLFQSSGIANIFTFKIIIKFLAESFLYADTHDILSMSRAHIAPIFGLR